MLVPLGESRTTGLRLAVYAFPLPNAVEVIIGAIYHSLRTLNNE